jgi:hypothetical protein
MLRSQRRLSDSCRRQGGKKMKTKTWTVITNTGKQADLKSDGQKKEVQKPTHQR